MNKQEYLIEIDRVIREGKYKDSWESLSAHPIPEWYKNSKLGFFIHWGLFTVPEYSTEWYPRLMYYKETEVYNHHIETYGRDFEYHDFIPRFKAEKFNADAWLDLFTACGADFIMPTAEHHDGFKMYKSELSKWNCAEMGPKRDVLGEWKKACEKRGVRLAASNHRAEHYWFLNGMHAEKQDVIDEYPDFYGPCAVPDSQKDPLNWGVCGGDLVPTKEWLEDWLVNACEIVDKYHISNSYFDFWTAAEAFRPYMKKFLAYYYNRAEEWGEEVVSFYKCDAAMYPCGVFVLERGQMDGVCKNIWQCETSTAYNSWCYCTTNQFKRVEEIICNMIDVWSKNACFALNVGPKADGSVCEEELAILKTIAAWTEKNKDAVKGTTVHRISGEGKKQISRAFEERYTYTKQDFRFLYRLGKIYAFALVPNGRKKFTIKSFNPSNGFNSLVKNVRLLGENIPVRFKKTEKGLELTLSKAVETTLPVCFEITVE